MYRQRVTKVKCTYQQKTHGSDDYSHESIEDEPGVYQSGMFSYCPVWSLGFQ